MRTSNENLLLRLEQALQSRNRKDRRAIPVLFRQASKRCLIAAVVRHDLPYPRIKEWIKTKT